MGGLLFCPAQIVSRKIAINMRETRAKQTNIADFYTLLANLTIFT